MLGPPLGNTTLPWRDWVRRDLVDRLVINQSSSQCPSMWHQLWPMHRGTGYVQNYLDGTGLPPLADQLSETYAPVFAGSAVELFVARQWCEPSREDEASLSAIPGVTGLVFGSFRLDNPEAVRRGDWRAGQLNVAGPPSGGPVSARSAFRRTARSAAVPLTAPRAPT